MEFAKRSGVPINNDDGTPGFGIYVHWPFCEAKCPYCDFNSHVRRREPDQAEFAAAYVKEVEHFAALTGHREVTSIFFGGGTPSLMEPATVDTILNAIAQNWSAPSGIEITMEANPSSAEATRFRDYRALGVNRLSLGVQALNDADLKALGRVHSVHEALGAIKLARETFPRMSFDLIYARSGQTLSSWEAELREAIGYAADHLSLYQLTIEDNTPFKALHKSGRLIIPDDDSAADMFDLTQEVTEALGLPAYEVSNHAAPGSQSRHNLTYWRYGYYVGIGPGAHGRITPVGGERTATSTEKHPEKWRRTVMEKGHGAVEFSGLLIDDQWEEMLLMGMRLKEGLDLARLEQFGRRTPHVEAMQHMLDIGVIERVGNARIRATRAGVPVLNSIIAELAA
ncbi:MAG: radical SAM family heme chaperone HemW [Pseudomonadota bacterium]